MYIMKMIFQSKLYSNTLFMWHIFARLSNSKHNIAYLIDSTNRRTDLNSDKLIKF
jgi:hypothetical protein